MNSDERREEQHSIVSAEDVISVLHSMRTKLEAAGIKAEVAVQVRCCVFVTIDPAAAPEREREAVQALEWEVVRAHKDVPIQFSTEFKRDA